MDPRNDYNKFCQTHLLHWLLFLGLPETEPLFPRFWRESLRARVDSRAVEHRLRLPGDVGGTLTAAPLHAVVSVHGVLALAVALHIYQIRPVATIS